MDTASKSGKAKHFIYLAELDSVRNSDAEIALGLDTLVRTLMDPDAVVVVSLNQLTDSPAMLRCLAGDNRNVRNNFIELFRRRRIVVNLYGNHRSTTDYIVHSLEKNIEAEDPTKGFIFSSLDIFDDPQFTRAGLAGFKRLRYMQTALRDTFMCNCATPLEEALEGFAGDKNSADRLKSYIDALLKLCVADTGYLPPKEKELTVKLSQLLEIATNMLSTPCSTKAWGQGVAEQVVYTVGKAGDSSDNRSALFKELDTSNDLTPACKAVINVAHLHTIRSNITGFEFNEDAFRDDIENLDFVNLIQRDKQRLLEWWVWADSPAPAFDIALRIEDYATRYRKRRMNSGTYHPKLPSLIKDKIYGESGAFHRQRQRPSSRSNGFYRGYLAQLVLSAFRTLLFIILLGIISAALGVLLDVDDTHDIITRCILLLVSALVSDSIMKIAEAILGKPTYLAFGERMQRMILDTKVVYRYMYGRGTLLVDSHKNNALIPLIDACNNLKRALLRPLLALRNAIARVYNHKKFSQPLYPRIFLNAGQTTV